MPGAEQPVVCVVAGNTTVRTAWAQGTECVAGPVVPTSQASALSERLGGWMANLERRPVHAIVASVVPERLGEIAGTLEGLVRRPALVVGADVPLPMNLDVEQPERVGSDRVCAAAAAFEALGQCCVVASFGTALTIDAVGDDGVFLGGAILPGLGLAARSLHEHTALLPSIEMSDPPPLPARNTEAAMIAGIVYGAIGALREITERMAERFGKWPPLILTGGDAERVARLCRFADRVDPLLTLRGVHLAYRRWCEGGT